jgi:hypothetical protein
MANTAPKPFVFVLMPFEATFGDVYQLGIKPAAEGAGAYCERIDDQIFAESILARIYNQIAKADLIVADMTGRNPNVFYEVGYAHALGKTVVLLTQSPDDIPFDLKHYPHIVYGSSITALKNELGRRVAHHLAGPPDHPEPLPRLQFTIAGTSIVADACIEVPYDGFHDQHYSLPIGINNRSDVPFDGSDISAGLVLPKEFQPPHPYAVAQLEDKRFLYDVGPVGRILPSAWSTHLVHLPRVTIQFLLSSESPPVPAELRVFTPVASLVTNFSLRFFQPR